MNAQIDNDNHNSRVAAFASGKIDSLSQQKGGLAYKDNSFANYEQRLRNQNDPAETEQLKGELQAIQKKVLSSLM